MKWVINSTFVVSTHLNPRRCPCFSPPEKDSNCAVPLNYRHPLSLACQSHKDMYSHAACVKTDWKDEARLLSKVERPPIKHSPPSTLCPSSRPSTKSYCYPCFNYHVIPTQPSSRSPPGHLGRHSGRLYQTRRKWSRSISSFQNCHFEPDLLHPHQRLGRAQSQKRSRSPRRVANCFKLFLLVNVVQSLVGIVQTHRMDMFLLRKSITHLSSSSTWRNLHWSSRLSSLRSFHPS